MIKRSTFDDMRKCQRAIADSAPLIAFLALLRAGSVLAELTVRETELAPAGAKSRVPEVIARGRFLAPQAVSAVGVSADGKFITVGTVAFSHDANVWQFAPDSAVMAKLHLPPWAPMQIFHRRLATLGKGSARQRMNNFGLPCGSARITPRNPRLATPASTPLPPFRKRRANTEGSHKV